MTKKVKVIVNGNVDSFEMNDCGKKFRLYD